ncbi:MAG: hypothetical protein ACI9J2_000560 [Saprospiraceae bacterium]|jgi:hypothetical protein
MRNTLIYIAAILLVFSGLDLFARHYDRALPSISDKTFLKKEMFLLRRSTDVLFLGSSRTQDAIDSSVLMQALNSHPADGSDSFIEVFNGGTAKASSEKLLLVAEEVVRQPGLKLLMIELSDQHVFGQTVSEEKPLAQLPSNTEQRLQALQRKNLYIVKHREAFRLKTLKRVPLLLLADQSEGSIFFNVPC